MAFTIVKEQTVFGNKRAALLKVTADAAESNIDSGLSVIEYMALGPQSFASSSQAFKINENSSGTASNGKVGVSGVASGDVFHLICVGR